MFGIFLDWYTFKAIFIRNQMKSRIYPSTHTQYGSEKDAATGADCFSENSVRVHKAGGLN